MRPDGAEDKMHLLPQFAPRYLAEGKVIHDIYYVRESAIGGRLDIEWRWMTAEEKQAMD